MNIVFKLLWILKCWLWLNRMISIVSQSSKCLQVDSSLASDKALELDAALGSCSVQYREIQGQESQKFLSYFRPCLIPIEGVFTSKQGNLNGEYHVSLYTCKGDYVVYVKEVSCFSSLIINCFCCLIVWISSPTIPLDEKFRYGLELIVSPLST